MKIENLVRANRLAAARKNALAAIAKIDNRLIDAAESDGGHALRDKRPIYTFHLTENSDGSGFRADLTGCKISIPVLKFTRDLLEKRLDEIDAEIATLWKLG